MKTIGVVAKELGISVETIRFYERKGLIEQPIKPANGYRVYSRNTIKRLKFILRAKTLGFTLSEILSLLNLSHNCKEVESIGLQKLALIRQKINDLKKLETVISDLTDTCQTNQNSDVCPIINSLSKD
ncbi:MerR family transcriptional regulator [Pseudoalteromonas sp. T1lg23B]|uniref:MerR family transcriptional regulator n=1 Tax=Pseudoalteromonas sp. T1lg23B TaxID=2077097 RepID=UPI000CF6F0DA|nr:MerR family transcriptional regulator [Pseudoalteromonas sp. T1lg23B]